MLDAGPPASQASSNWFGVTMSAAGTAWSRKKSGIPGLHEEPPALVAHDRIAGIDHVRPLAADPGHRPQHGLAQIGVAQIA